jgi:hypothetical protein
MGETEGIPGFADATWDPRNLSRPGLPWGVPWTCPEIEIFTEFHHEASGF